MPRPLRVLLIEDSEFDAALILRLLTKGGYELQHRRIETAAELSQALEDEWDLIIADYNLPQFGAPAALEQVKETGRDVPFIIVSGAIGETTAVAAMKAGAHDYLMKDNLARLLPVLERELREAENREGRRRAKEALHESELRYRLLWETATDAVILFDKTARIDFANPAVEEIFGYSAEEIMRQSVFMLQPDHAHWHQKGGLKRYLKTAVPGRNWRARETVGLKKNGMEFPVEVAFSNLQMGDKSWFVAFFRDITERKKAERELQENQEQFRVAREIQQHLFPKAPPQFDSIEIAGATFPADATGGDYYDYLPLLGNCQGLVVGDVTGHGIGPALLMAETRAYLRILAKNNTDSGIILTKANRVLAEDVGYERFITLFIARFDPLERKLAYANAGHIPGYIFDQNGELQHTLKRTGIPLGLRRDTIYHESAEIDLLPGQTLLMLTDGFEEATSPNEEFFGNERIFEFIKRNHAKSAHQLIQDFYTEVKNFIEPAPQLDDLTALILKVK